MYYAGVRKIRLLKGNEQRVNEEQKVYAAGSPHRIHVVGGLRKRTVIFNFQIDRPNPVMFVKLLWAVFGSKIRILRVEYFGRRKIRL